MKRVESKTMHSSSTNIELEDSHSSSRHVKTEKVQFSSTKKTESILSSHSDSKVDVAIVSKGPSHGHSDEVPNHTKPSANHNEPGVENTRPSDGNTTLYNNGKMGTPRVAKQQGAQQAQHHTPHQTYNEPMASVADKPGSKDEAVNIKPTTATSKSEKKSSLGTRKGPVQTINKDTHPKGQKNVSEIDAKQSVATPTTHIKNVEKDEFPDYINAYKPMAYTSSQHINGGHIVHTQLPGKQPIAFTNETREPTVVLTPNPYASRATDVYGEEVKILQEGGQKPARDNLHEKTHLREQASREEERVLLGATQRATGDGLLKQNLSEQQGIRGEKIDRTPVGQKAEKEDKGKKAMSGKLTAKSEGLFQRSADKKTVEPDKPKSKDAKAEEKVKQTQLNQQAAVGGKGKKSVMGGLFQTGTSKKVVKSDQPQQHAIELPEAWKQQPLEKRRPEKENSKQKVVSSLTASPTNLSQRRPNPKVAMAQNPAANVAQEKQHQATSNALQEAGEKKRKAEQHTQELHAKEAEARRKKHEQEAKDQKAKDDKAAAAAAEAAKKKRQKEMDEQHKQAAAAAAAKKKHDEKEAAAAAKKKKHDENEADKKRLKEAEDQRKAQAHKAAETEKARQHELAEQQKQKAAAAAALKKAHDEAEAEKKRKKALEDQRKINEKAEQDRKEHERKEQEKLRKLEERRRKKEETFEKERREREKAAAAKQQKGMPTENKAEKTGRRVPPVRPTTRVKGPVRAGKK